MSGAGMAGVTYFASNKDDPYVTLKNPVSEFCKLCYTLFAIHVILNFPHFNASDTFLFY